VKDLTVAYAVCEEMVRRQSSSFYWGMRLLPSPKRRALMAVYAWCRLCDDAVDTQHGEAAAAALSALESRLDRIVQGRPEEDAVDMALCDTAQRFRLPEEPFRQLLVGMATDLCWTGMATFDALRVYCERVAGTVGRLALEVFGYRDPEAPSLAVELGVALQLINILRDVVEDAGRGRVYLPLDQLAECGVEYEDVLARRPSPALSRLVERLAREAARRLKAADALTPLIQPDARACLRAIARVYGALLRRIEASGFDVISRPPTVPGWQKLWVAGTVWL
jgi:phytoene synthase